MSYMSLTIYALDLRRCNNEDSIKVGYWWFLGGRIGNRRYYHRGFERNVWRFHASHVVSVGSYRYTHYDLPRGADNTKVVGK